MRILHVGKFYAPFRGGMETVLQNIAEGLLDGGHEVSVLVAGSDSVSRTEDLIGPQSGRHGRLVRSAALGQVNSQPLTAALYSHLRREIAYLEPDVVHVHLPNPLAAAVWKLWARGNHGPSPALAVWHHADVTRQRFAGRLVRPLTRSFLADADGISTSSQTLADHSRELAGHLDRVGVIPFGIDPQPWIDIDAQRDGPFLFLGRLVRYKGLNVLIDAMKQSPRADLVIVGEGPLEAELRVAIGEAALEDRISMVGRLDIADTVRLMERAQALVLPSIDSSETFGLVQLEAMAAGVPVIATDLPTGVREVGVPEKTGLLIPPGDVSALAAALQRLGRDRAERESMGKAGRRRFREHYTRSRMMEKLIPWYESLIRCEEPRQARGWKT